MHFRCKFKVLLLFSTCVSSFRFALDSGSCFFLWWFGPSAGFYESLLQDVMQVPGFTQCVVLSTSAHPAAVLAARKCQADPFRNWMYFCGLHWLCRGYPQVLAVYGGGCGMKSLYSPRLWSHQVKCQPQSRVKCAVLDYLNRKKFERYLKEKPPLKVRKPETFRKSPSAQTVFVQKRNLGFLCVESSDQCEKMYSDPG